MAFQSTSLPVPCGADAGFKLSAAALEAAIGPRTRWLLLNTPSNPTGAAYSAAEVRALDRMVHFFGDPVAFDRDAWHASGD